MYIPIISKIKYFKLHFFYFLNPTYFSVGIATRYGLHGLGIESRWVGKIFRTRPHRPWGPPSLLYNGYRVFPGSKAAGARRWPPTPSSAEVEGRVELYICSPLWAFVVCSRVNFTFTFTQHILNCWAKKKWKSIKQLWFFFPKAVISAAEGQCDYSSREPQT